MGRRKSEVQQAAAYELDGLGVTTEAGVGGVRRIRKHVSLRRSLLYPYSIVALLHIQASQQREGKHVC